MDEAIIQLHRSGYKIDDALSELNANDIILTTDVDYMTQDDAKKFAKGIKQLGKNFSRIHRELLPHHSRVSISNTIVMRRDMAFDKKSEKTAS